MLVNSGDPRSGEPFDRLRSTLNGFAEIFNRQTPVRASGRNTPPVLPVFARNCLSRINELFTSLFSVSSLFSFSPRVFLASSSLHGFFTVFLPLLCSLEDEAANFPRAINSFRVDAYAISVKLLAASSFCPVLTFSSRIPCFWKRYFYSSLRIVLRVCSISLQSDIDLRTPLR